MNTVYSFTIRDVVNLFCWHIPAVIGWFCIVYAAISAREGRQR